MFKKITTLFLAVVIFTIASSISIFGQAKLADENQTVSQKVEPKNEKLRNAFLKKENVPSAAELSEKETMASYQKQKKQGQKFSTATKIIIGVGAVAAAVFIIGLVRYGNNEQVFR
jgi:Flp pilus assembly protein TadB